MVSLHPGLVDTAFYEYVCVKVCSACNRACLCMLVYIGLLVFVTSSMYETRRPTLTASRSHTHAHRKKTRLQPQTEQICQR